MKIACKGKSKALRDQLDLRDKKSNFKHFTAEVTPVWETSIF